MSGWWKRFERFLETDPRDDGCDAAVMVLHVYADLLASGIDAAGRYPGAAAHYAGCESCAESLRGLVVAIQNEDPCIRPQSAEPS